MATVEALDALPTDKIQMIRSKIEGAPVIPKPSGGPPPPPASAAISKAPDNAGALAKNKKEYEDPFAMSKNPGGFYPPRKVTDAPKPVNSNLSGLFRSRCGNAGEEERGQRQFNFKKPVPTVTSAPTSLYSECGPPSNKRPALSSDLSTRDKPTGGIWRKEVEVPKHVATNRPANVASLASPSPSELSGGVFKSAHEVLVSGFNTVILKLRHMVIILYGLSFHL